jgi:hypothetical protein
MPLGNNAPGFSWVAEYAVSGIPWVTSSVLNGEEMRHIHFYAVTKELVVKNVSGSNMQIGFTARGTQGSNNFVLASGESFDAEVRVVDLWISGTNNAFTVFGALTTIPDRNMPRLTGSYSDGTSIDGVG